MSVKNVDSSPATLPAANIMDIPGERGLPFIGNTLKLLKDPAAYGQSMQKKYGLIYRSNIFFRNTINMIGPEANEFVLMDKGQNFSSEKGWGPYLARLFPRGLMLMDFDHHKAHRSLMTAAFKTAPMKGYLNQLNDAMPQRISDWGKKGNFKFYPAIKQLSLDMASTVFLGLKPGEESNKVNKALTNMVAAAVGLVRVPIPGTLMGKGVKSRQFMVQYLGSQIEARRKKGGDDIFTQLCQAEDEKGLHFTDQEIIDHMNFLWMAAHDTVTSSVTTLVYELGRNPDWQKKLRFEINGLGIKNGHLSYAQMGKMELTEYAFKEALRINPPVPAMPRRTVRDIEFKGFRIPAGTDVGISTVATHRLETVWPNPKVFDPMRFSPEGGAKERHKFAWIPFGGGAHMCLGLHFAYMQTKVIMAHLLPKYEIILPEGYRTKFQIMPLIKPVDGLPITLKEIE